MQAQSRVAVPFRPEPHKTIESIPQPQIQKQITETENIKPRDSKVDLISASVVYGLTAQFVAFMFGVVTEYIPNMMVNVLLSTFMGLCVGVIAYAVMKNEH